MSENSLFDLSGRTAFVSGASRGLGQQFSIALAAAGADIVMTARKAEDLWVARRYQFPWKYGRTTVLNLRLPQLGS